MERILHNMFVRIKQRMFPTKGVFIDDAPIEDYLGNLEKEISLYAIKVEEDCERHVASLSVSRAFDETIVQDRQSWTIQERKIKRKLDRLFQTLTALFQSSHGEYAKIEAKYGQRVSALKKKLHEAIQTTLLLMKGALSVANITHN